MNELILLMGIFIAAGVVKGVTGMGLPTVAMGLLSLMMPLPVAAALLVLPSFITNIWQLFSGPSLRQIVRRLWPMMVCIVPATVAGSALLIGAGQWATAGLGVALIVYASYALLAPALTVPASAEAWLSPITGAITGVVTGATGVFVMPSVPYLQALSMSKDELVQALGLSFTLSTVALAGGLAAHNAFAMAQLNQSLLAIVPALLGMWLGQKIRSRLSATRFRMCFLLFLLGLGAELASRPFI